MPAGTRPAAWAAAEKALVGLTLMSMAGVATAALPSAPRRKFTWFSSSIAISRA